MGYIYQIRNIINGAVYIGSVLKRDPNDRWVRHRKDLRGNYHHSQHLQRAWNKYGEDNFVFEILEQVDVNVLEKEQWYLNIRKKEYPSHLTYNVCWTAGNCQGRIWSSEMRKKLSISHLGHRQTPEAKQKQLQTWEKKCKNPYSFMSPDGIIYDNVRNLRAFAREHNLNHNSLRLLHKQKLKYHAGWTKTTWDFSIIVPPKPIRFILHSPDNFSYRGTTLKSLCLQCNINYKMVHKYCIKMNKPYQGWTVTKILTNDVF